MNEKLKALRPDLRAIETRVKVVLASRDIAKRAGLTMDGFAKLAGANNGLGFDEVYALLTYVHALEDEIEMHEMGRGEKTGA